MLTLLTDVDVFTPAPAGVQSILIGGGRILALGAVDVGLLELSGVTVELVRAEGLTAIPGLIDPHAHLIGGSGEEGFGSQTPEVHASELVSAGITTVVGALGVDTTTRTMMALLARVKALNAYGLTARAWTGGYGPPYATITGSIRSDIILIEEVIGAGEIAIADRRALEPDARELARLSTDCSVSASLTGKAGLLHLHVGPRGTRLDRVRRAVETYDVEPGVFYPTHLDRSEDLLHEAADLSKRGMPVDLDVFEQNLAGRLVIYRDAGGDLDRLTVSSDTAINAPATILDQLRDCARREVLPFDRLVSLATINTARILRLERKGRLTEGCDADIVLLDRTLALHSVYCGGVKVFDTASGARPEAFLERSNRHVRLVGRRTMQTEDDK